MLLDMAQRYAAARPYKAYQLIFLREAADAAKVNEQAFGKVNREWVKLTQCSSPLPACGERSPSERLRGWGVRGTLHKLRLAEGPLTRTKRKRAWSDLSPQAGRGEMGSLRRIRPVQWRPCGGSES